MYVYDAREANFFHKGSYFGIKMLDPALLLASSAT